MPPTETKSYTPGAERAARVAADYLIRSGLAQYDSKPWLEPALLEIFSRETHDAEMLEALAEMVKVTRAYIAEGIPVVDNTVRQAKALIAKVEGQ